jgi:hypothetical protein
MESSLSARLHEDGGDMSLVSILLYIAGAVLCYAVFTLPIELAAGIGTVAIFHRTGRKRHMGVERPRVLGLNKNQMLVLLYGAGVVALLSLYTMAFLLVVNRFA